VIDADPAFVCGSPPARSHSEEPRATVAIAIRYLPAAIPAPRKETPMPRVSLDATAPELSRPDFSGRPVSLSDYRGRKNVLLVFNRTFT